MVFRLRDYLYTPAVSALNLIFNFHFCFRRTCFSQFLCFCAPKHHTNTPPNVSTEGNSYATFTSKFNLSALQERVVFTRFAKVDFPLEQNERKRNGKIHQILFAEQKLIRMMISSLICFIFIVGSKTARDPFKFYLCTSFIRLVATHTM